MAGETGIFIAAAGKPIELVLERANRHGLIAGATGTGKTVTIQGMIGGLSAAGVQFPLAKIAVLPRPQMSGWRHDRALSDRLFAELHRDRSRHCR